MAQTVQYWRKKWQKAALRVQQLEIEFAKLRVDRDRWREAAEADGVEIDRLRSEDYPAQVNDLQTMLRDAEARYTEFQEAVRVYLRDGEIRQRDRLRQLVEGGDPRYQVYAGDDRDDVGDD